MEDGEEAGEDFFKCVRGSCADEGHFALAIIDLANGIGDDDAGHVPDAGVRWESSSGERYFEGTTASTAGDCANDGHTGLAVVGSGTQNQGVVAVGHFVPG